MSKWSSQSIEMMVQEQKRYYEEGHTRPFSFRIQQLKKLKEAIVKYEGQLSDALYADLHKSRAESYATEIGLALSSLSYTIKQLKGWMKPKKAKTPLTMVGTSGQLISEPYGVVLIIAPFNYPVSLVIEPLIGAIAAGNCVVIKPSEFTPNVARVIKTLIEETFEPSYIQVVLGEQEETSMLIHSSFDFMFFTGSTKVGKIIMRAASEKLVPVALELGGKSPAIIEASAKLDIAAKRIAWGKLINNGQTCIAPDYIVIDEQLKASFIEHFKAAILQFYTSNPQKSEDYGRIVTERHFERLYDMVEKSREHIIFGGHTNKEDRYIEPTLIDGGSCISPKQVATMEEEVFGPICTIITYKQIEEAIPLIRKYEKPLALYVFTENKQIEQKVIDSVSFGGGCVNDTLSHYIHHDLPFGGVGPSGIGGYHGKHSFDLFSHKKSIVKRMTLFEPGLLFPPYKDKLKLLKKLLK